MCVCVCMYVCMYVYMYVYICFNFTYFKHVFAYPRLNINVVENKILCLFLDTNKT